MYGLYDTKAKDWVKISKDDIYCYGFFDTVEELISVYAGQDVSIEEFVSFNYPRMLIIKMEITFIPKNIA